MRYPPLFLSTVIIRALWTCPKTLSLGSKHITIKHHAIREYVAKQAIELVRTPTGEMLADGLTKSLPRASFYGLVNGLGFTA